MKGNEGSRGGGWQDDVGSQAGHQARGIGWGIRLQKARAHDAWRPDGHGRGRMGRRWPADSTVSAALHPHSQRSHPHPRLPPQSHAQCHVKPYESRNFRAMQQAHTHNSCQCSMSQAPPFANYAQGQKGTARTIEGETGKADGHDHGEGDTQVVPVGSVVASPDGPNGLAARKECPA